MKHSYSRLSTYIRCPKAYDFQYVQKLPSNKSGPMLLGGVCHDFFEAYDRHLMAVQKQTDHAAANSIMQEVFHKFERPVPPALYDEYLEICEDFVQDHVLDLAKVLGAEVQIAITRAFTLCAWDAPEVWFRFKLDRLDLDRETGRAIITDYKTGWGGNSDPFQLLLYACAIWIMNMYGQLGKDDRVDLKAVEVVLFYNRSGRETKWIFSPEQIDRGIEQMEAYAERVEQEKEFKPTPGAVCASCDFAGVCPARAENITAIQTQEDANRAGAEAQLLKAQAAAREEMLELWVSQRGPVQVRGSEYTFGTRESYKVINAVGFVEAVTKAGMDPIDFYKISTTQLKKRCQKNADLADLVAPYIAVEVKETFGLKPCKKTDPFASSTTNQGETNANDQTKSHAPAANKSNGADESPALPALTRADIAGEFTFDIGGADGPRAGGGQADRDAGANGHEANRGLPGPIRLPRGERHEMGARAADPPTDGPGSGRRRPF